MIVRTTTLALAATLVLACSKETPATPEAASSTAAPAAAEAPEAAANLSDAEILDVILASEHRTPDERARDMWRHPKETLLFFEVTPASTVVEISPGGGWYTNVIAPYLAAGGGVYYAALFDPALSERAAQAVNSFKAKFQGDQALYGDVRISVIGSEAGVAPAGAADVVLTFRNVHNWTSNGSAEANFKAFYNALKPGGVLGVVEHRANEDADEGKGETGYVKESTVKALALGAGFEFDSGSEINANPADTKDHPFGVWTLPPVRRSTEAAGAAPAPDFDRAKYDAIGESDRMTLKFRKPLAAEGALLE